MGGLGLAVAALISALFFREKVLSTRAKERLAIGELGLKERGLESQIEGKKLGILEKKKMTKTAMKEAKSLKRSEQMQELTLANKALSSQRAMGQTQLITNLVQAMQGSQTSGIVAPPSPNVPVHTYLRR